MHQTPDVSLADASAMLASAADVTSDEFRTAFHTFYRACGRAAQVPPQQDLEAPLIEACVTKLAELAGRKHILWRQIHDCVSKLRSLPGCEVHVQSDIALNILKSAGIYGGWDQLERCRPGEPMDIPGKYRITEQSSIYEAPPREALPLSAPVAELTEGTVVDIEDVVCNDKQQLWGSVSITGGWILLLDMQSGLRSAVKETEGQIMQCISKEDEARSFLWPAEEDDETSQLIQLRAFFEDFCELAILSEESVEQVNEITAVRTAMIQEWNAHQRNSRLHYVFGGLVSSGKTTLLNSWLVNSLERFPEKVELLDSDYLENTSMVAILEVSPDKDAITMHTESVEYHKDAANYTNEPERSPKKTFENVSKLKDALPDAIKSIERSPGTVCRVVIQLPFAFVPFMADEREAKDAWIKQGLITKLGYLNPLGRMVRPKSSELQSTSKDSPSDGAMAPILVDTPGLDSVLVKHQLLSVLQEKSCVYAFLVDMTQPNPFGKQGFQTLKFLIERLRLPFPPVIVFTKWERFERQWNDPRFKRSVKNRSPPEVAEQLIQVVFDKLQQAQLKVMPYFAAVNAQAALLDIEDAVDEDEKTEIPVAKADMKQFMRSLHDLGSQVASPLRDHRVLSALMKKTQGIVNLVLRDSEDARLLSKQADVELTDVASGLKARYRANVLKYFEGINWTREGVASFEPPPPFNKDDCAVNRIPSIVQEVFEQYKENNPRVIVLKAAVLDITNSALAELQHLLLQDMHRFEEEIMSEFEKELREKMGHKGHLMSDQGLTRAELVSGAVVAAGTWAAGYGTFSIVMAYAATATETGVGVLAGCGAATGLGFAALAALPVVGLGAAYMAGNHIGIWSWASCEKMAFEEVLKSLKDGQQEIMRTLTQAFDGQVDGIMKSVRDFRVAPDSGEDSRCAGNIMRKAIEAKHKAEEKVNRVLNAPLSEHWLSGKEEIKEVWLRVAEASPWAPNASKPSSRHGSFS